MLLAFGERSVLTEPLPLPGWQRPTAFGVNLTLKEQFEEYQYRVDERLGILCEDREPTPKQREIAEREAQQWLEDYQKQFGEYRQGTML